MKKVNNTVLYAIFFLILLFIITISLYIYNISAVNKNNNDQIVFEIKKGDTASDIGKNLESKKLIKNITIFKIYIKLNKTNSFKAGYYNLNQAMNLKTIINTLDGTEISTVKKYITLKEGQTIKKLSLLIEDKTDYKKEDFLNLMIDKSFINELIDEYWFLSNDILNKDIYYPLEGYLFPNTYDVYGLNLEQITKLFLTETNKILTKYKNDITKKTYDIHELISLASIVELEGNNKINRGLIAGIFYNRLSNNITLGSDVTAYYAAQKDIQEKLTTVDLTSSNPYNTRYINNYGIPVGPICNPGEESINAVLNETKSDYFYFVADIKGNIYFMKTYTEHKNKIKELDDKGLW